MRESPHRGTASYDQVLQLAQSSLGDGKDRLARAQFVELVRTARRLGARADSKDKRPFPGTIDQMHDYLP